MIRFDDNNVSVIFTCHIMPSIELIISRKISFRLIIELNVNNDIARDNNGFSVVSNIGTSLLHGIGFSRR